VFRPRSQAVAPTPQVEAAPAQAQSKGAQ
jgi:hypothetical protein